MRRPPSRRRAGLRPTAISLAVMAAVGSAHADPDSWIGPDNGLWSSASNWSNGLPTATSDLLLGSFATQINSGTFTVNSFAGTGLLTMSGGTLSFAAASSIGALTFSNGTLSGNGDLIVAAGGQSTWTGGVMTGTGSTTFDGALAIAGNGVHDITSRTVNFAGTTTWNNGPGGGNLGQIRTGSGATLNNSGSWLDQNSISGSQITNAYGGAASTFNNTGLYDKTGTAGTTIAINFVNAAGATLDVEAGTLALGGNSTLSGNVHIASGAVLNLYNGTNILNAPSWGSGTGEILVSSGTTQANGTNLFAGQLALSGGTFDTEGAFSAPTLTMSNGTLTGAGSVSLSGPSTWTGGIMTGTGSTTFNGSLAVAGNGVHDVTSRTVNFAGTTTWNNNPGGGNLGQIRTGSGATLNNSGTWIDQNSISGSQITNAYGGTASTFNNSGTYDKTGTAGTTIAITYLNTGTTEIEAGTLALGGNSTLSGNVHIASGAVLNLYNGANILNTPSWGSGTGEILISGGTTQANGTNVFAGQLALSGGTFDTEGAFSAPTLTMSNGTLTGAGSLTLSGPSTWTGGIMTGAGSTTFNGALTVAGNGVHDVTSRTINFAGTTTWNNNPGGGNLGQIRTGSGAALNNSGTWIDQNSISGSQITNAYGGTASTFNNSGTYDKTGSAGTTIAVNYLNTGTTEVEAGTLALGGNSTISGNLHIASGAVLNLYNGTNILNTPTWGSGTGEILVSGGTTQANGTNVFAGQLALSGGTFDTEGAFSAPTLTMSNGTLTGAGSLTLSGTSTWTGGIMTGAGSTTFNGALAVAGNGVHDITSRTVNFVGATTWNNNPGGGNLGQIRTGSGAALNNSGTWIDQNSISGSQITNAYGGTASTFNNIGTYDKTGSAGTTIAINYLNTGTTEIEAGTLALGGNSTLAGNVHIASGAVLNLYNGTNILNAPSWGAGTGQILVSGGTTQANGTNAFAGTVALAGGTLDTEGAFSAPTLTMSNGTLTGAGSLTLSGPSTWTGGIMTGAGSTTFNGALAIAGNGVHDVTSRTINFAGTTTWNNNPGGGNLGQIRTGSGATLNNSGTWIDQNSISGSQITNAYGGTASSFNNSGTYQKTGSATTTIAINYLNTGTTDVQAGTLSLPANFSNPGTLMGAGTIASTTITNNGHVAPGDSIGTLSLSGNFAQGALGSLDIQLAGAASDDLLKVSGSATLGGTLALSCFGDCRIAAGTAITILDASPNELVGTFADITWSGFGAGRYSVDYDRADGDVILNILQTTAPVPEPAPLYLLTIGLAGLAVGRRRLAAKGASGD